MHDRTCGGGGEGGVLLMLRELGRDEGLPESMSSFLVDMWIFPVFMLVFLCGKGPGAGSRGPGRGFGGVSEIENNNTKPCSSQYTMYSDVFGGYFHPASLLYYSLQ